MDIEKKKAELESKLRELKARAEQIDDDLGEPGDDDWEEHAAESSGDEVLEEVGDVTLEEIEKIKLALTSIAAGTYGICSNCGDPIAEARMTAIPEATRCIKCA